MDEGAWFRRMDWFSLERFRMSNSTDYYVSMSCCAHCVSPVLQHGLAILWSRYSHIRATQARESRVFLMGTSFPYRRVKTSNEKEKDNRDDSVRTVKAAAKPSETAVALTISSRTNVLIVKPRMTCLPGPPGSYV